MNILHLRYAVEVAKEGSINKASDRLLVAQPNLSRSIKELEADLGITLFERSSRGMFLTPEGEQFISHAKSVLAHIDEVEQLYKGSRSRRQRFSVSVPRASYISAAFTRFCDTLEPTSAVISYQETNSGQVITNVASGESKLGVVRYSESYEGYFKAVLAEKGLTVEPLKEFNHVLLMHRDNPLAAAEKVTFENLEAGIEVIYADTYVPSLRLTKYEEPTEEHGRHIYVYERASQLEILAQNPDAFSWVSPSPQSVLDRYGLTERALPDLRQPSKDVLVWRKDYRLTELDKRFIDELKRETDK